MRLRMAGVTVSVVLADGGCQLQGYFHPAPKALGSAIPALRRIAALVRKGSEQAQDRVGDGPAQGERNAVADLPRDGGAVPMKVPRVGDPL